MMTNQNRLKKVTLLATTCDHVQQVEDTDFTVHWPSPNYHRQYATIDRVTGEITHYRHVSGTVSEEVQPKSWLTKIDRRINYLMERASR